jgi:hypothetical protein
MHLQRLLTRSRIFFSLLLLLLRHQRLLLLMCHIYRNKQALRISRLHLHSA